MRFQLMNNPTNKNIQITQKALDERQAVALNFFFGFFIGFSHSFPPFSITDNGYASGEFQVRWLA